MYPTLHLPGSGLEVRSHDVMVLLAAVTSLVLAYRWTVRRDGARSRPTTLALLVIGAAAILGGRLHFILVSQDSIEGAALYEVLVGRSMHAPGAIGGAAVGAGLVLWLVGTSVLGLLDSVATAAGIGIALGRIGCFLHGCCFGTLCSHPWAVSFPRWSIVYSQQVSRGLLSADSAASLPVHPLQLYFAASGLLMSALLLWMRPRRRYDGQLCLVFLVLFGASTALLECLRDDQSFGIYWGPLPQLIWVAGTLALAAAGFLVSAARIRRESTGKYRSAISGW